MHCQLCGEGKAVADCNGVPLCAFCYKLVTEPYQLEFDFEYGHGLGSDFIDEEADVDPKEK